MAKKSKSSNAITGSWDAARKAAGVASVEDAAQKQQDKLKEVDTLIEHTVQFVAARMEAENQIGAVLSMKQVLKYEAHKDQIVNSLAALDQLLTQINASPSFLDVDERILAIVQQPIPTCSLSAKDDILNAAKLRLEELGLQIQQETQTGRAA